MSIGSVCIKAAARSALLIRMELANADKVQTSCSENYQEGNFLRNNPNTYTETHKKELGFILLLDKFSWTKLGKDNQHNNSIPGPISVIANITTACHVQFASLHFNFYKLL